MAAAKALLAAAGLLHSPATEHAAKPNTSTATEHAAKLPKTSTATEHATSSSQPDTAASKPQASASLSYFSLGDSDLEKIVALLMWMTQNSHPNVPIDDIHHAALEAILKHSEAGTRGRPCLLHEASIAKLSELIDIMMLTKDGKPKDPNETLVFMRRVATIREEVRGTSSDNATERFELDHDSVSLCYKLFGRTMLQHDLMPHQKKNKQYWLRWQYDNDTHLTTFQRSWTDNMLRKFLGDKKVAMLIWQHGLPSVADPPVYRRGHRFDIDMLQSGLDDCLKWYSSLANEIVVHQTQEGFVENRLASSLEKPQKERQQRRREELQKAKDALWTGAALVEQRDRCKRSFEDMDDAEQEMLHCYETGKAEKAKQDASLPKMNPFRCELQVGMQCKVEHSAASTATEHAAKRRKHALLQALLQNTKKRKKSISTECNQATKRRKKRTATEHATASSQPDTAASKKVQLVPRRKSKTAEVEAASAATGHAAKRRKKRRKKSTATEHATSSSQPDTAASTKVQLLPRRQSKMEEVEVAKAAAKVMVAKAEAAKAAAAKAMVEKVALQKQAKQKDEAARIAAENADAAKRAALQAAAQQAIDQAAKTFLDPDSDAERATDLQPVVRECNRLASGE